MFERFTDRARRVLVLAQDEAKALEHNFLGTEHVLLGLIKEGEGVGAKALQELGVDYGKLRAKITSVITPGEPGTAGNAPPFTPRAKKCLELALAEALQLGHNYIGTEHVLLGLIREGEGVASQVLVAEGLEPSRVRSKVVELLAGFPQHDNPLVRRTPAVTKLDERAKRWAGVNAVGSQHYLLALLEDPNCLAARVLSSLGVTSDAALTRIRDIGDAGTSDEIVPPPTPPASATGGKPAAKFTFGDHVTLTVDDPAMAATIVKALHESGQAETAEARSAAVGSIVASIVSDAVGAKGTPPSDGEGEPPSEEDAAPPASE